MSSNTGESTNSNNKPSMKMEDGAINLLLQFDSQFANMLIDQSKGLLSYLAVIGIVFTAFGYCFWKYEPEKGGSDVCTRKWNYTIELTSDSNYSLQDTAFLTHIFAEAYISNINNIVKDTVIKPSKASQSSTVVYTNKARYNPKVVLSERDYINLNSFRASFVASISIIVFLIIINFIYAYSFRINQFVVEKIRKKLNIEQCFDFGKNSSSVGNGGSSDSSSKKNNHYLFFDWMVEYYKALSIILFFSGLLLVISFACRTGECLFPGIALLIQVLVYGGYCYYFMCKVTKKCPSSS